MQLHQTIIKLKETLKAMEETEIGPMLKKEEGLKMFESAVHKVEEAIHIIEQIPY